MKFHKITSSVIIGLLTVVIPTAALACTSFALPKSSEKVMAKSLDWHQGHGLVISNPRNLAKTSIAIKPTDVPATWRSRYGSVTLHQQGRELPLSGLNEEGLAIEILWLDSTAYPKVDARPSLNELQWTQYQLDNYATVAEVLENANRVRISGVYAMVHYFVCDKSGQCATLEFLNGELKAHTGSSLPVSAIANHSYEESIGHLKDFIGFGGAKPLPTDPESLSRFVRASNVVRTFDPATSDAPVALAFRTLKNVSQGDYSKWNIVYELKTGKIHFRTLASPTVKTVDTKSISYSCKQPSVVYNMSQQHEGSVNAHFVAYSAAANLALVNTGLKQYEHLLPPGTLQKIANYPDSFSCEE